MGERGGDKFRSTVFHVRIVPANIEAMAAIAKEIITAGPAMVLETDPART